MNQLIRKSSSLLQVASDLHLEIGFKRFIKAHKPFLLLAGDIGYPSQSSYKDFMLDMSSIFDKVFILSGNHEFDGYSDLSIVETDIKNICEMRNNLFYLQKTEHTIDEQNKIVLAGCTLFSELPKIKNEYHLDHSTWLQNITKENKDKNYIIVTHHCPHVSLITKKFRNFIPKYFTSDQSEIFIRDNVFMWIFGHTHDNVNIIKDNTLFYTNQYGKFDDPIKNYKEN